MFNHRNTPFLYQYTERVYRKLWEEKEKLRKKIEVNDLY